VAGEAGRGADVLEEADMASHGMGALIGRRQGTADPAKFIILEHAPRSANGAEIPTYVKWARAHHRWGGISIKPSDGMEWIRRHVPPPSPSHHAGRGRG
jgi:leucyl aminopeptidase